MPGAQFVQLWNSTSNFQSMVLSYEVAFDANFDFVKSGGAKYTTVNREVSFRGCGAGQIFWDARVGSNLLGVIVSAREYWHSLMWRTNGNGEGTNKKQKASSAPDYVYLVYAYIRPVNGICDSSLVRCNDDFGSFAFQSGTWNRITMLVRLNSPENVANGQLQLLWVFSSPVIISLRSNHAYRYAATTIYSPFHTMGYSIVTRTVSTRSVPLSFCEPTGEDSSWASPKEQHTYFRNIRMWGSDAPSNMTGNRINAASSIAVGFPVWLPISVGVMSAFAGLHSDTYAWSNLEKTTTRLAPSGEAHLRYLLGNVREILKRKKPKTMMRTTRYSCDSSAFSSATGACRRAKPRLSEGIQERKCQLGQCLELPY
ncbi:hypothetical protein AG1IA_03486 [Rhizoctonia solani AG-1 IA]|uniref:Polysaccharide lyase 14 domain-containing protein n=1 Tax=Thanatephorus cucumeris (strain AG1-IA) TaxID=983506 RepID=L8WWK1_THACA|nr:hypothetical protein AG1IA_03486 [Rhizoctonia solani AG-1 IA]